MSCDYFLLSLLILYCNCCATIFTFTTYILMYSTLLYIEIESCRSSVTFPYCVLCTVVLLCTAYCVLRTVLLMCIVYCIVTLYLLCTVFCVLCTVYYVLSCTYCIHCVLCTVYCIVILYLLTSFSCGVLPEGWLD